MRYNVLIAILCAATAHAEPSGAYLTWMGCNAGYEGGGNYSTMYGAYSGASSSDLQGTSFMGVMSGYHAWSVYDAIGLGFRALQDSQACTNVYAIGRNAGREAYNNANCLFIGPGAGRSGESLTNCVFIGAAAGYGANGVTDRTYINGQFYADSASGSFYIRPTPGTNANAIAYSNGVLKVNNSPVLGEADIRSKLASGDLQATYSTYADYASHTTALIVESGMRNGTDIDAQLNAATQTNAAQTANLRSLNENYRDLSADVDDIRNEKRDKSDLAVYSTNSVKWVWSNVTNGVAAAAALNAANAYPEIHTNANSSYVQIWLVPETCGKFSDAGNGINRSQLPEDLDSITSVEMMILDEDNDEAYIRVKATLTRLLKTNDTLATVGSIPAVVTNIVHDISLGGIWDSTLQVWWTPRMRTGSITYEATTTVNLNAEN